MHAYIQYWKNGTVQTFDISTELANAFLGSKNCPAEIETFLLDCGIDAHSIQGIFCRK